MKKNICLVILSILVSTVYPGSVRGDQIFVASPTEITWSSFYFLCDVKSVFEEYKLRNGKYPAVWNDAWTLLQKKAVGYRMLSSQYNERSGNVLKVTNKKGKPVYRYIIDRSDKASFQVHSENFSGEVDYKITQDEQSVYWYFPDEKSELAKLSKVEKDYSKKSLIRRFLGQGDPMYIGSWMFEHPAAMDLLIRFLQEDRLEYYTKHGVVIAMKKTPRLYRFKSKFSVLKSILDKELNMKVESGSSADRKMYTDALAELVNALD